MLDELSKRWLTVETLKRYSKEEWLSLQFPDGLRMVLQKLLDIPLDSPTVISAPMRKTRNKKTSDQPKPKPKPTLTLDEYQQKVNLLVKEYHHRNESLLPSR